MSDLAEADSAGSAAAADSVATRLLRDRSGWQRVTNIELFFARFWLWDRADVPKASSFSMSPSMPAQAVRRASGHAGAGILGPWR